VQCQDEAQVDAQLGEARKLEKLPPCDNIVRLIEHQVVEGEPRDIAIYLEYAPWGDLMHLLSRYASEEQDGSIKQIPEPFIWLVFYALSEAIYVFNTGRCAKAQEDNGEQLGGEKVNEAWQVLLHRDIKPASECSGACLIAFNVDNIRRYFTSAPQRTLHVLPHPTTHRL
jgi:serine/threonine protein kinase